MFVQDLDYLRNVTTSETKGLLYHFLRFAQNERF